MRLIQDHQITTQDPAQQQLLQQAARKRKGAILISFFFGGIGGNYFYHGKYLAGVLSFVFCWTAIPSIIGLVDAIKFVLMTDEHYARKYIGELRYLDHDNVLDRRTLQPAHPAPPSIDADVSAPLLQRFTALQPQALALQAAQQLWLLVLAGEQIVSREPAQLFADSLPLERTQLPTITLQCASHSVMLTPKQLIAKQGSVVDFHTYQHLTLEYGTVFFDEDPRWWLPSPPTDAQVIRTKRISLTDHPDPAQNATREIPVVEYGRLNLHTHTQQLLTLWCSNKELLTQFGFMLEVYIENVQNRGDKTNAPL